MSDPARSNSLFRPTAALTTLQHRSRLTAELRRSFAAAGYWEVDVPLISHDTVVDAWLEPAKVELTAGSSAQHSMYLQTSPEFAMKRLLASGADAIYAVTHAVRDKERGRLHNPEFTMVEWYRTASTYHEQMDFTEQLVRDVAAVAGRLTGSSALPEGAFERLSYDEAFERTTGQRVLELTTDELSQLTRKLNVEPPPRLDPADRDGWLNLLLAECVEPRLGQSGPQFVYDYPASQSALAEVLPGPPPVACRFELYLRGIELCNGYQELLDADELRKRNTINNQLRVADGREALPTESHLLSAMESGLPGCSGVALGFDRLCMLLLGKTTIDEVLTFPFERA